MSRKLSALLALVMIASMLLSGCAPAPAPAAPPKAAEPTAAPAAVEPTKAPAPAEATKALEPTMAPESTKEPEKAAEPTVAPTPTAISDIGTQTMKDRVPIYWYIGLGAGAQPDMIQPQKDFVKKFNDSQKEIELITIIIDNKYPRDNLTTQIASGNAPDIIGPVGTAGRAAFPGAFLDLSPLVKEFNYDMSDTDPAFMKFFEGEGGKLEALPFASYPSFIFVNKDLFEEADLPLPPQKYGDKYTLNGKEMEWSFDTLLEVAKILTVDKNGNDATSKDFDIKNVVQWGFVPQWVDEPRAFGTYFGAFYPVDKDGKAVISDNWKAGWQWYYDAMWKYGVTPNQSQIDGDLLKGNAFSSGKVAMGLTHSWYTCCVDAKNVPNWDAAVVPSYKGKVTAKLHGDTFAILSSSKHPKEAFQVYTYMLGEGAPDLYKLYGALPARKSQQAAYFESLDKKFAPNKVNWQVAMDSIQFMDAPNHEAGLPNNAKSWDIFQTFGSDLRSTPNLDVNKRVSELITALDQSYAEKK